MQYNACYTRSMQYDALDIETQAGTRKKPMALELTILVGTMTGTAQLVAQELELTLDDGEIRVRTTPMDGLDADVFSGGGLFLICSSTYVQCGVIALGDRTYADTFCNGGKRFDAILSELGAWRIGEIMLHDASAGTMP